MDIEWTFQLRNGHFQEIPTGTPGGDKGLRCGDQPDRWGELVRHTDELPEWTRPYFEAVRARETARGDSRPPRLRLV